MRFVFLSAVVLGGCGAVTQADYSANLIAVVQGDTLPVFRGSAVFTPSEGQPGRIAPSVVLRASGEGGFAEAWIMLHQAGFPAFTIGVQDIDGVRGEGAAKHGIELIYFAGPSSGEYYVSQGGTLRIREATSNRVSGEFTAELALYCWRTSGGVSGTCTPASIRPDAKRVTLRGTFTAPRAREQHE